MTDFWRDLVLAAIREMIGRMAVVLPNVLAMLTLLALGVVLGLAARAILTRLARALDLDRRSQAWGLAGALLRAGIGRTPSQVVGLVAFWAVVALFATMGIDALSLPGSPGMTATLVSLLPRVLAAALILIVGWLAANFLGQAVLIAAVNAGLPEARLLSRGVRWAVMLFTAATTLTQIGIGTQMVMVTFGVTFGGVVFALALAFGLGGRHLARGILERRARRDRSEPHPRETLSHL
jgi:hypothetical protein